jgi:hypothetical protein
MLSKVIPGYTARLGPPEGMQDCNPLFVRMVGPCLVSRWEPTPIELKLLNMGGSVELWVYGEQPPVALIAVGPDAPAPQVLLPE